jgi:hypothetical protein
MKSPSRIASAQRRLEGLIDEANIVMRRMLSLRGLECLGRVCAGVIHRAEEVSAFSRLLAFFSKGVRDMVSRLLVALPLLLQAAAPPSPSTVDLPPIKMGLWEATVTTAMGGTGLKTRTCLTAQDYREQLAHLPQGCTLSNVQKTSTSMSGDVKCNMSNGASSSGHIDVQFPDPSTVHATIKVTTTVQGQSMPITITTDSRFIGADCEDLEPGQSKVIQ